MKKLKTWLLVGVALLSYSFFFMYTFQHLDVSRFTQADFLGMLWFFILLLLVTSFPIQIKKTNIVFIQAVTVAIFLQFGYLVEALMSQLALLYVLLRLKARTWERYVLNGTMFLYVSTGSAVVYRVLEANFSSSIMFGTVEIHLSAITGYILTNILINHLLLYVIRNYYMNEKKTFFGKDFWWEVIPLSLITPTGILIYLLYAQLHTMAIIYVMLPLVTFSIIFRLYNKLDIVNQKLRTINQTGNVMTGKLDTQHVVHEFVLSLAKLVQYQYCYIFQMDEQSCQLKPIYITGDQLKDAEREAFLSCSVKLGDGLSGQVAQSGRSIRIGSGKSNVYFEHEPDFLHHQHSILAVPLIRNGQVNGVITLSHRNKNVYSKEDATLVEILANQAAIALRNASRYEETKRKSEVDELTGLYNYGYFEHLIFNKLEEAKKTDTLLSLILLDIDHFKKFNDRYGHLSGNMILKQIARLLEEETGADGVVTRYGGEEFTILLEGLDMSEAYARAEKIRSRIEMTAFEVHADLNQQTNMEVVTITVSIGIASYPAQAEDPLNLIRHADRAMYMGAKQKGRNKVAVYHA